MKTVIMQVNGMACDNFTDHLKQSLSLIKGVHSIEVDLMSRTTRVKHDETVCRPGDLVMGVQRVGFQVAGFKSVEAEA